MSSNTCFSFTLAQGKAQMNVIIKIAAIYTSKHSSLSQSYIKKNYKGHIRVRKGASGNVGICLER